LNLWVPWNYERRGPKWQKVPTGEWKTGELLPFAEAHARAEGRVQLRLGDGIGGVDLDNSYDPETGAIEPWALEILQIFKSYAEISPSGTGIKIFALGAPDVLYESNGVQKRSGTLKQPSTVGGTHDKAQSEFYVSGRLFTVTGRVLPEYETLRHAGPAWK